MYKHLLMGLLTLQTLLTSVVLVVLLYMFLTSNTADQPPVNLTEGLLFKGPCNDTWIYYHKSCYKFEQSTANWTVSASHCADLGAHLIEVDDQQENDFARVAMIEAGIPKMWLGVNDQVTDGKFELPSGAPVRFLNFAPSELKNTSQGCVFMSKWGKWGDKKCLHMEHISCEKNLSYI